MISFSELNQQKEKSEKFIKWGWILFILGVLIMWFTGSNKGVVYLFGVFTVIGALILDIIGVSRFNEIKKTFKNEVLQKVFKEVFKYVEYNPLEGIKEEEVYKLNYLKKAARFKSEDYLQGKIDDVSFISSDVKLEELLVTHTKNGKKERYKEYFLGRVFIFDFNKNFLNSLTVVEKGKPINDDFHKIELESIEFNEKFDTYTVDDETAFYILTPHIMEAILQLEKRNKGSIGFTFNENHLYVAIDNKVDTFDLKLHKKINDEIIKDFINDLKVIGELINTLKLSNKIFIH